MQKMRTHKLVFDCSSTDTCDALWDFLTDYFVDVTHWFSGLDFAGDDTPETCLIYRGYIRDCRITVEFNREEVFHDETDEDVLKIFDNFVKDGRVNKLRLLKIWDKIED